MAPPPPPPPPTGLSAVDALKKRREAEKKKKEEDLRRQKEKEEADKAEAEKEAKARAAREKRKKERDAQRKEEQEASKRKAEEEKKRKEEEEAAKAAAAAAEAAAAASDKPDDNINDILNDMNSGGDDVNMEDDDGEVEEENDEKLKSPKKKRSRKDKKKGKERKEKEDKERKTKDTARTAKTYAAAAKTNSALKSGRYAIGGGAAEKAKEKKREEMAAHVHKYPRWILELSIRLSAEDKHSELVHALRKLLENAQKTCSVAVLASAKEGKAPNLYFPSDISFNLADLNSHVKIQNGANCFSKKAPWGKKDDPDVEPEDPVVYLSLAFSTDEEPEEVIEGIAAEWSRCGGMKMYRKKLDSFKTVTPVCFFYLLNSANQATVAAEVKRILEEARDRAAWDDMVGSFEFTNAPVPDISLRVAVPQIKGQDTTIYKGWSNKQQWFRKVIHVECDKDNVEQIKYLTQLASDQGLFTKYWGKKAKAAILDDKGDEAKLNLNNLISIAKRHVNYEASMTYTGLVGVMNLDKEVEIKSVTDPTATVGTISFRQMLYGVMKLPGNPPLPLFSEVHQKSPISSIDTVIPNCPEAETMVGMMNKNIAAYLYHYLQTVAKMDKDSVMALLEASVDPSLLHTMGECTWDEKDLVLTTPEDKQREEEDAMEKAAWYKDAFAAQGTPKKTYANRNMMFNVDDAHSVTSIHHRPGKTYAGSPGAATIDLSGDTPKHGVAGKDDSTGNGDDEFLAMSKEELIAMLKQGQDKRKGSQPESEISKSSSDDSGSKSSSDSSSSSSRSTPGEGEAAASQGAAGRG